MLNNKNIFLLCIILLILLCLFVMQKNKQKSEYIFVLLSTTILCYTFLKLQSNVIENYEDTVTEPIVNESSTQLIVNENINDISDNLVVYLSSYNTKSYANHNTQWNNLVIDNKRNKGFIFSYEPILTSMRELKVQSNKITGPFSMDLGIDMKNSYSIFLNAKIIFNASLTTYKLFELYATKNNVGIYLHIIKKDGANFIMLTSAFTEPAYFNLENSKKLTVLDNNYHLFTVTKNSEFLKLYLDNIVEPIITAEVNIFDNKFSNRNINLVENTDNNIISYITHFGVYNKELAINKGVSEIVVLYDHIKDIMLKQSDSYNALLKDFNKMKKSISLTKVNPFNSDTIKDKCSMITDWSSFDQIITNADDKCLRAINEYCQTDKDFEQCKVWNNIQKLIPFFSNSNADNQEDKTNLVDVALTYNNDTNDSIIKPTLNNSNQSILNDISTIKQPTLKTDNIASINAISSNSNQPIISDEIIKPIPLASRTSILDSGVNSNFMTDKYNQVMKLFASSTSK